MIPNGLVGDGLKDDTDAIQTAVDSVLGGGNPRVDVRYASDEVRLPAGNFLVTRPIRVYSAAHFRLIGCGAATRLIPRGRMSSVLDLNGIAFSQIADFRIEGDGVSEEIDNAIYYYFDDATARRSSAGNELRGLSLFNTNTEVGIRIGKYGSNLQVDTTSYSHIIMVGRRNSAQPGRWKYGIYCGSEAWGNNLVHNFYHISCDWWENGLGVKATPFGLFGGSFVANGVDFDVMALNYFRVAGVRSENSGLFAKIVVGDSPVANLSFSDVSIEAMAPPGGEFIQARFNGTLNLSQFYVAPINARPRIRIDSPRHATLHIDGMTSAGRFDDYAAALGPNVDVLADGMETVNPDGTWYVSSDRGVCLRGPIRLCGANGGGGRLEVGPKHQLVWVPDKMPNGRPGRAKVIG